MSTLQDFADKFSLSLGKKGISFSNHGIYTNGKQTFIYLHDENETDDDQVQSEPDAEAAKFEAAMGFKLTKNGVQLVKSRHGVYTNG